MAETDKCCNSREARSTTKEERYTSKEARSTTKEERYTSKEVCLFLSEYAVALLGCAATCIRLDRNVNRIATTFGKRVELFIMPRHIHMTVRNVDGDDTFTFISTVKPAPISFSLNTKLSQLSWHIADDSLSLDTARHRFETIMHSDKETPWVTLTLASFANASFCGIFGGDLVAMLIVLVATAIGFRLKQMMGGCHTDGRVIFLICAFISSVIGSAGFILSPEGTPSIAVGTSVLYLVPGIPFLNSFSDLLYRHYICAISRFTDAIILTACLSLGLCLGMRLMGVGMF